MVIRRGEAGPGEIEGEGVALARACAGPWLPTAGTHRNRSAAVWVWGMGSQEGRGSGRQVRMVQEPALWSFWSTSSFREAILAAANLGDDSDTTAAITGQVAGAHFGLRAIPEAWLEMLWERETVGKMGLALLAHGG